MMHSKRHGTLAENIMEKKTTCSSSKDSQELRNYSPGNWQTRQVTQAQGHGY